MDPTLVSLLDSIPQKSPRSKLETHRELIRQLRRKGCTYRDIVRVLHERVGLKVAVSTIHSFVKVRAKLERQVWTTWLPVVATAALALGFALGTWFADVRQGTPEASSAAQSQQMPMPEAPAQQVVPQRNVKHH